LGSQGVLNQHQQGSFSFIKVSIDAETAEMIKKRFGETFAEAIKANIEIKTPEVARKDARGGKRKPRENKGERKPREQKDEKKEDKPAAEEAPKQEAKK
jgi:hypothetical protein